MAPSFSYILTRFAKSVFTGPVRPTPGTAVAYSGTKSPDAGKGFNFKEWMMGHFPDQQWPGDPPIDIEIKNLARPADKAGIEESLLLVGINPGGLQDNGNTPQFNPANVLGRSSPFQVYLYNGARTVKATLPIHRDMFSFYRPMGSEVQAIIDQYQENLEYWKLQKGKYLSENATLVDDNGQDMINEFITFRENAINGKILEAFRNTINWLRALQYPVYVDGGVIAPKVYMRIGKFIQITGFPSIDVSYSNIYAEGYPVKADIGIMVTETVQNAYDQDRVYNKQDGKSAGMDYVEWPSK